MEILGNLIQTEIGKKTCTGNSLPEEVEADKSFEVKVSIGDAIAHPNTLEHHIAWFKVFSTLKDLNSC